MIVLSQTRRHGTIISTLKRLRQEHCKVKSSLNSSEFKASLANFVKSHFQTTTTTKKKLRKKTGDISQCGSIWLFRVRLSLILSTTKTNKLNKNPFRYQLAKLTLLWNLKPDLNFYPEEDFSVSPKMNRTRSGRTALSWKSVTLIQTWTGFPLGSLGSAKWCKDNKVFQFFKGPIL